MKIFQKISHILAVAILAATCVLVSGVSVYADEVPEYRIQMSPARNDIGDLKPGETYTGTFLVQNTGTKEFDFTVGVTPYSVIDEKYNPDYSSTNQYTDIAGWITFSQKNGSVKPNNEVEVAYSIKVPADVPAGGQYAMLYAEINADDNTSGAGVAVARRVGMLLYSNVQGNTRKTATIEENKISSFLFKPPISATSIVKNSGNTHATAEYILQVYPLFGDEEVYTNEEDPAKLIILPETRRFNTVSWEGAPHLGIFRVKQTVKIFGEESTTEKLVFIIPLWFLFIILLIIFCIIFWIVSRIRNRNKY